MIGSDPKATSQIVDDWIAKQNRAAQRTAKRLSDPMIHALYRWPDRGFASKGTINALKRRDLILPRGRSLFGERVVRALDADQA